MEAGEGEHRAYWIHVPSEDQRPLTPNEHYLGVDAVGWYINRRNSWFVSRTASGTLEIRIGDRGEKYQVALGTFELKDGAKTAPVFDRAVLPDRNYCGGTITVGAFLTAIKTDTVLSSILKSASAASLNVVAGMVQTATVAGPVHLLGAAAEELISGVKRALLENGEKRQPLFDFSGFEASITPERFLGPEKYLLLHRGTDLRGRALSVQTNAEYISPCVDGEFLEDGAWLLLRLRRASRYSGQREWYQQARTLRGRIETLIEDVKAGVLSVEDARLRLQPSSGSGDTIFDEYARLRALIHNDAVLSDKEAMLHAANLRLCVSAARESIEKCFHTDYRTTINSAREALRTGLASPQELNRTYEQEHARVALHRRSPERVGPELQDNDAAPDAIGSPGLSISLPRQSTTTMFDFNDMQASIDESFSVASAVNA